MFVCLLAHRISMIIDYLLLIIIKDRQPYSVKMLWSIISNSLLLLSLSNSTKVPIPVSYKQLGVISWCCYFSR